MANIINTFKKRYGKTRLEVEEYLETEEEYIIEQEFFYDTRSKKYYPHTLPAHSSQEDKANLLHIKSY